MQCPSCGKTGFVNISGKRFCSNCGAKLAAPNNPATMSDIKTSPKILNLKSEQQNTEAAPSAGVLDLRAKDDVATSPAAETARQPDVPEVTVEPLKTDAPTIKKVATDVRSGAAAQSQPSGVQVRTSIN